MSVYAKVLMLLIRYPTGSKAGNRNNSCRGCLSYMGGDLSLEKKYFLFFLFSCKVTLVHYIATPMQYTANFTAVKMTIFR